MIVLNTDGYDFQTIHDNSFPFPDLSNPLYISKREVISDGQLIAGGIVRLTTEGILFTNKDCSLHKRTIASKAIIQALKEDIKKKGLDECHVFVQQSNVACFLERLGFKDCKGGNAMIIHF